MKAHDSRRAGKSLLKTILAIVVAAVAWFAQQQGWIASDNKADKSGSQKTEAPKAPAERSSGGAVSAPERAPENTPVSIPESAESDPQSSPWDGKDDARLVEQSQKYGKSGVSVELPLKVVHLLPDDTDETPHQNFLADTSTGHTLKISHNTALAPYVPIKKGDVIRVKGDFETTKKGGVVHWTHWDPRGRHTAGWIELNGKRYGKLEGSR